jgi:hypothetical protein
VLPPLSHVRVGSFLRGSGDSTQRCISAGAWTSPVSEKPQYRYGMRCRHSASSVGLCSRESNQLPCDVLRVTAPCSIKALSRFVNLQANLRGDYLVLVAEKHMLWYGVK